MTNKIKATKGEVDNAMALSQVLLSLAVSQSPHVGLTALIMATAVASASLGVPLENITAVFEKSAQDAYAAKAKTLN